MGFRINRVYTRSGDQGETGLVGGARVSKTDLRVEAYGDIDELNSTLGLVKEEASDEGSGSILRATIEFLQQELFDLGAELATPPLDRYPGMWVVTKEHVEILEKLCDHFGEGLPELTSFILPGGSRTAAALHQARVVARRAERAVLRLKERETQGVSPELVCYVNRLSDLFFILARWTLGQEGKAAPLWVQESKRKLPIAL